jgi:hypothetical protein
MLGGSAVPRSPAAGGTRKCVRHAVQRAVVVLVLVGCGLAAAQAGPAAADTISRGEVVLAARQALEAAGRNLGRVLTIVVAAMLVAAAVAVWRIWALSRQVARLEDLRSAWETRFAGTADEVLRLKRKLSETESRAARLEDDIAALRPAEPEAATAQVAMVQSGLVALGERLARTEEKIEAFADHTVVTGQERALVEELVRGADRARAAAEAAAARAESIATRTTAIDSLRAGDEKLAQQQYPAAVQAYDLCLESLGNAPSGVAELRFHALRSRAVANLRQREFDAVLADSARIDSLVADGSYAGNGAQAQAAARLLAGAARLWQGDVTQALADFAGAAGQDPGARVVILRDEDIAAWVRVNPKKAAPVKLFIRQLRRKPGPPRRSR